MSVSVDLNDVTHAPSLIRNDPGVNFTAASYFNQVFYAAVDQRGIFISSVNRNPVLDGRATFFTDFVIAHHSKQPGLCGCPDSLCVLISVCPD